MASPAAALLAAYNGKLSQTPGNNYGGFNPFGVQSGTQTNQASTYNPGIQAQQEVGQAQDAYKSQQAVARSQLQASLAPSSVGGQSSLPDSNNQTSTNSDPFAGFNSLIGSINQRGVDATGATQLETQATWQNKLGGLAQEYQKNLSQPASWGQGTVDSILGKLGVKSGQGQGFGFSGGFDGQGIALPAGADPNSPGSRAVALAEQVAKSNVPYVWGGNSLTQGVDCSGLVQQVYGRLGIQLPRTSSEQAKYGKVVPNLGQALPGDLILMYSPYEPTELQQYGHVGIYIGNGQMVEAPGTGKNVRIAPIYNMTKIVRPW